MPNTIQESTCEYFISVSDGIPARICGADFDNISKNVLESS